MHACGPLADGLAETTQINFKSQHILRFDMLSNDVQSEPPHTHACTQRIYKNDSRPTLSAHARKPEFDNTPEILFLLYFSYNTSPYGSLILD